MPNVFNVGNAVKQLIWTGVTCNTYLGCDIFFKALSDF